MVSEILFPESDRTVTKSRPTKYVFKPKTLAEHYWCVAKAHPDLVESTNFVGKKVILITLISAHSARTLSTLSSALNVHA